MPLNNHNTSGSPYTQRVATLPSSPDPWRRYSIGWIAPLPLELTAAKATLDEDYGEVNVRGYIYYRGRIGSRCVVMAVQPRMGTDAASDLAARMRVAFQEIEYFVVVGIGGGVPRHGPPGARSEIVLGDVVVSCPAQSHGGVVRYDSGAQTDHGFQIRGHTNGPPDHLLNTVGSLRARHAVKHSEISVILQQMRTNINVDRHRFDDPGAMRDRLFQDDYQHPKLCENQSCDDCCDLGPSKLRNQRGVEATRTIDNPRIHYGNIGSSNTLQTSSRARNKLHEDYGIICFEMEGAGVIQSHPCLVIRGICDYSDSHKNKIWQPYAAATAAAYAKELIEFSEGSIPAQEFGVIEQPKTSDHQWFYRSLQRELWELESELSSCTDPNHVDNENQLGFINCSTFQSWLAKPNARLWCRLGPEQNCSHSAPGACLIQQATRGLSEHVVVFWYGCKRESAIDLPPEYVRRKQEYYHQHRPNDRADGKESFRKQDLAESILLSFLMQAIQQGFQVQLDGLDFTNLQIFMTSLIGEFVACLKPLEGRVVLVVDSLHLVHGNEQDAIIGALNSIIAHEQLKRCSLVLAAEATPSMSLLLQGYAAVQFDSEYQECLQSLFLENRHIRRGEIAEPVRQSNSWIWDHQAFLKLMSHDAGALAVIGKPGSGKSVLAKTIQRGLSRGGIVADWFYCRRKGNFFTAYLPLLKSIVYEVLARKDDIFSFVKRVYRRCRPSKARTWSISELEEVITCLAQSSVPLVMVFDALDEAQDANIIPLVELLVSVPESKTRVIVLSRPIQDLERPFWSQRLIVLQDENDNDIKEIIDDGLSKLSRAMLGDIDSPELDTSQLVRQHTSLRHGTTDRIRYTAKGTSVTGDASALGLSRLETALRERSQGVILWVVLVFESLYQFVEREVTVTVDELGTCIDRFPTKIDSFYEQMVEDLTSRLSESALRKARTTLIWINTVSQTREITLAELWDALAIPADVSALSFGNSDIHPIIRQRVAIRDWSDFHRKLRRMCGSFIEVLPDRQAEEESASGPFEVSGESVIQLMHQTVKDFLTVSPGAAALSFSEHEASEMVMQRCLNYVQIVLPGDGTVFASFRTSPDHHGRDYMSQIAMYLDEFRLLELCCQVLHAEHISAQADLIWRAFDGWKKGSWIYDTMPPTSVRKTSSALGFLFHFATARGLTNSIRSLLGLSRIRDGVAFWDIHRDSILNGVMFSVLDNRDHRLYTRTRRWLIFPNAKSEASSRFVHTRKIPRGTWDSRREPAVLALDRLYDTRQNAELLRLDTRQVQPGINDIYSAISMVVDFNTENQDESFGGRR